MMAGDALLLGDARTAERIRPAPDPGWVLRATLQRRQPGGHSGNLAAKTSSFDAHCSIDVSPLRGTGLEETKTYLTQHNSDTASAALDYLIQCQEMQSRAQPMTVCRSQEAAEGFVSGETERPGYAPSLLTSAIQLPSGSAT